MRHGKKFNHLSRTASHRRAMLANMASSLIKHKRVSTTVAKAKALRTYVEPLITKSKEDTTHSRRVAFSYLQDKDTVKELFSVVAGKVAGRPGGYTRIIKVGNRAGDNADMCVIELVDFNENLLKDAGAKPKAKRSRRGGKKKAEDTDTQVQEKEVKAKEQPKATAKAEATEKDASAGSEAEAKKTEEAPEETVAKAENVAEDTTQSAPVTEVKNETEEKKSDDASEDSEDVKDKS